MFIYYPVRYNTVSFNAIGCNGKNMMQCNMPNNLLKEKQYNFAQNTLEYFVKLKVVIGIVLVVMETSVHYWWDVI